MLARKFGKKGVRVNGVSPGIALTPVGGSDTDLESLKKLNLFSCVIGSEPIAEAVVFLARSKFITGQILAVDAGQSLK